MSSPLLVSTFELTFKSIAPVDIPAARRAALGYFLTIANCGHSDVSFTVRFTTPSYENNNQIEPIRSRTIVSKDDFNPGNHDFTFDITGGPEQGGRQKVFKELTSVAPPTGHSLSFESPHLSLKAGQTGIATLTPRFPLPSVIPTLEVYGFVELVRQDKEEAEGDVLLSAQSRGTLFPNDFPLGPGPFDFDQVAYSLPLASGTALNKF